MLGPKRRVRLVLELECDTLSLVALRLALRDRRAAGALRSALAEALEGEVAARTGAEVRAWRYVVKGGVLEAEPARAEPCDAPPERSAGGPGEEGGTL